MNDTTMLPYKSCLGGACKDSQGCELGRILRSVIELTVVGMRYWKNGQMLTG